MSNPAFQDKRSRFTILVVDDDSNQRNLLVSFLTGQGFPVESAASGEEALNLLDSRGIQLMISDVRMPGVSGLEMLRRSREKFSTLPILLITAYPDVRDAVHAMRDGAVNYLEKPIDLDELLASVLDVLGIQDSPSPALPGQLALPEGIVAQSPLMREIFHEAALVAPTDSRVLITGESGVGKEILADVIHAWSPRRDHPLIKVNCASIPDNLLESELFGHEKGAFTGAAGQRIGRFEEADKGTILLDEIAEMSPSLQAKLLRVTQDGSFERVGSNTPRITHARVLASTNRNLEEEVEKGNFREDLFFRLNVMEIYIPPLRERREDIVPLAKRFAERFSQGNPRLSASLIRCLEEYEWPGNVRELRNAMERAVLMARGELIIPEHLPKRIQKSVMGTRTGETPTGRRMEEIERAAILEALRRCQFNRTETAKALGISRRALTYKLQRYAEQGFPTGPE
ncbi:MAG: sigma-54-dependent transcriptional regulator [bacterium]